MGKDAEVGEEIRDAAPLQAAAGPLSTISS